MPRTAAQAATGMPPMGDGTHPDRTTPRDYFNEQSKRWGPFLFDAAASHENALCADYATIDGTYQRTKGVPRFVSDEDGLAASWQGVCVWVNPPYSRGEIVKWVRKAHEETRVLKRCPRVVMLLPSNKMEQSWWQDYVWDESKLRLRPGVTLSFPAARLKFDGMTTGANFPSVLVIFDAPKAKS